MNLLITYLKWCVFHKCARLFQSRPGARCLLSHLLSDLQANQCDVAKSLPGSKSICERGHPCSLWSGQNLLEWCTAFVCKIFPQGYCVLSVPDFWPPFDHCCANALWNAGKACCDNQQWAFSRFGLNCAEPINFTFQRRSIPPCRSSPTRKARGSNPPGRTKKRIAMYFCNALFYSDFRIILVAYHLPHQCTVLLPAFHFSADSQ